MLQTDTMRIETALILQLRKTLTSLRMIGVAAIAAVVAACGTTGVGYVAKPVAAELAEPTIERLVMTQHQAFRPDDFIVTDDFFGWSFGAVSRGSFSGAAVGGAVFGSSSERVRQLSDRAYYSQITEIRLYSWKRKMKQWWLVSLVDKDDRIIIHALRTLSREDAELMVDSLDQFLYSKTGRHPVIR